MLIARRRLVQMLAAAPLLAEGPLAAQVRVAGARILVQDDRVWVQVRFGARGPLTFIIDTGAVMNLMERSVVRQLNLRELAPVRMVGVGGVQEFTVYEARDVMIGNAEVGTVRFGAYGEELPLHPQAGGALSASILTTADSDLDFDTGEWRIHPDGRGERPGFERLASRIDRSASRGGSPRIHVDAEIDGLACRLLVDTGAPGQVILHPGASRRLGLWNDRTPFSPHMLRGIGGEGAQTRLVRGGALSLGGIRFERPLLSLTDPDSRDTQEQDGVLGLQMIEQLNLSTDVGAGRLWAKRNARPPRPERYGISGMWVDERPGGLEIAVVSPASPAAEAGLQVGDWIIGVSLQDLVRRLAGSPGESIEISYQRGGEARTTRLTLRAYL